MVLRATRRLAKIRLSELVLHFVVATDEMARMSLHCLQPTCTFFQTGLTS